MITLCGFGVSNYYNKLKLILLEKEIAFREKVVYPWQRDSFRLSSPLGKIPFVETEKKDSYRMWAATCNAWTHARMFKQ